MGRIGRSLTYANVMATIAVFIALGGGAYAAITLPKNSVGTKQIKKDAVVSKKVKDGSLLKEDFKAGQLTQGPQGTPGPQGPKGDPGTQGIQGQSGDPGSAVAFARVRANGTLDSAHSKNMTSTSLSTITGVYCVTPAVPVTSVVISTPHEASDTGNIAQAGIEANGDVATGVCSTPVWVAMRNGSGANENHSFYLVFN